MADPVPPAPLRLALLGDGAGGLLALASGRPGVALQARQPLPADGLQPWLGAAWQQGGDATAFGTALAQALLPPGLQQLLATANGGPLLLLLDEALAGLPWELAVVDGQALDDRFLVARLVLAPGADGPTPDPAGPVLVADSATAAATGRAGQPAIALPADALPARQAWAAALAEGAAPARAGQAARQAARRTGTPGADAWLHGEAVFQPAALAATTPDDDVRQVSILSVDLMGSTRLMHELGDEEYSERLTLYHQKVAQVARAHAGLADDPQGDDGFM